MRIIILNQFFYPDHSATSQLMTDLAESLVERGVAVTALAGRGRYNGGELLASHEIRNGVRIERAWCTSRGKTRMAGRIIDYLSFYLGATWKLMRMPHHDLVMALTTPPLIGLIALLIGRMRGMRVVALVQDVYPDVAVALGTLRKGSTATSFFNHLNKFVLRHADRVIVLGECMKRVVEQKIGREAGGRVDVIHNWADGAAFPPRDQDAVNPFVIEHELQDKFVVLFSGNLGLVNEFATVLEAARLLRDRNDIVFLFIGGGAKAGEIATFAEQNNLKNVRLLPYQPRERLRDSIGAGHVHLVTLAEGLAGLSVPSKTYGILAAGRPVLFVGDEQSCVAQLLRTNNCGAVLTTGESEKLARAILDMSAARNDLDASGARARALFEKRFDRTQAVNAYLETFGKCFESGPARYRTGKTALKREAL